MIAQATTLPQINAETLTTMRLPELWEVFAQVTGESSRCPNRNFLVRRILEVTHRSQPLSVPRPAIELVEDAPTDAQDAANDADDLADAESADDLADADGVDDFSDADEQAQPFLDEDDTAFAHAVNESDDDPEDKVADDADNANADGEEPDNVIDAEDDEIAEDEIDPEAFEDEEEDPNALHVANEQISIPDSDKPIPEQATEANEAKRKSLRGAPIEVLQARYLEVVGKPTTSSHRTYLLWKIKQVERGLIVPRLRPATTPIDDEKFQVLPIRLPISTVEQMDAACERLGLANRMVLFRRALRAFFFSSHEPQVARLFDPAL